MEYTSGIKRKKYNIGGNMLKNKELQKLPKTIEVGGLVYKITYTDKPSDTDAEGRQTMWGQIDYWDRSIRIYIKNRTKEDIYHTLLHEIIHAISQQYQLGLEEKEITMTDNESNDKESSFVDIFSLLLFDTLKRNDWLKI